MEQWLRQDKLSRCQPAQMFLALQAGAAQLPSSVEVILGSSRTLKEMAHIVNDSQGCSWCYTHMHGETEKEKSKTPGY